MKKIVLFILVALTIVSCTDAGTIENADMGNHPKYKFEKYWYEDGDYVIIAERKDDPTLRTVTRDEVKRSGNTTYTEKYITIIDDGVKQDGTYVFNKNQILLENDSIIIIRK